LLKEDTMAVRVLELHHHGIRVNPDETEKSLAFYRDVLGLTPDTGRPHIPGIPGYWMDCGNDTQIHIMGCEGTSRYAKGPKQDPTRLHVALAVPDIQEAKRELDRIGVTYWSIQSVVGPQLEQIFMEDPHGNLVELHEIGSCRCRKTARPITSPAKPSVSRLPSKRSKPRAASARRRSETRA
jgi:catechol 2,3-dioxygenase-like lactoylglutathione lyase family enzyme